MKIRTKEYLQQRMVARLLALNVSLLRESVTAYGRGYFEGQAQGLATGLLAIEAIDVNTYFRIRDTIEAVAKVNLNPKSESERVRQ